MKVGDKITIGKHTWKIEGIHLGAAGQESLIQLKSLTHSPGWTGEWEFHPMTFVPEIMLRQIIKGSEQK